ncbi:hypothetical protein BBK36DRAFT_1171905 [Trichoderma citrinoviride]|uniref:C2H2-type domain-containing protein n=1 Tax=Trichoderma citrinoviride TaxID=58853 RepID=A0A2T4B1A4_9HYPO|nr:hypothetical protein BBK36DRAFT_1171905 [Trichoderma citrinoviride]PTB63103.1 hypothetical protein BBK36DRAFT_1171905 [Trichoderma citrinoviride]
MRHKVKVPPCRYCSRIFPRTEHLRRHERTHTKEKPHGCICGRTFSRQDLLARHVKLTKEEGHGPLSPNVSSRRRQSVDSPGPAVPDAAANDEPKSVGDTQASPFEANLVPAALRDDLDMLWDSFQLQYNPFELSYFNPDFPLSFPSFDIAPSLTMPSLSESTTPNSDISMRTEESIWQDDLPCASALLNGQPPKRPTVPPRPRVTNTSAGIQNSVPCFTSSRNPCYMTSQDYDQISLSAQENAAILPLDFQLPSKHTLSRYIEGYSSWNLHRPFLHLSTTSFGQMPLELVFAIAAMGAQYRFEPEAAVSLYYAAKSVIDVRLSKTAAAVAEAAHNSTVRARPARQGVAPPAATWTNEAPLGIETIQAMIICMSLCSWEYKDLLPDAFSLAEQVALYLRQGGYLDPEETPGDASWPQWIQSEGRRRTVFIAFILFNLHTIFYDVPPRLMAREIWSIKMPQHEAHWWASTTPEWKEARRRHPPLSGSFGDYYLDLMVPIESRNPNHRTSAFGSLVSIHGLVQQIQLTRDSLAHLDPNCANPDELPFPEDVYMKFRRALCRWDTGWASSRDSATQPIAQMAPLGFNATAVFRIAWVRLGFSMVVSRNFSSRDAVATAAAFARCPLPQRSPRLYSAVLQSAHALSIPVRIGIRYASKTQIFSWSIVHSIANLECALFLSKWLQRASVESGCLQDEERILIRVIARILKETPFYKPAVDDEYDAATIKHMACSVLRLFTELFKESHLFDAVGSCIEAADRYASTLER